MKFPSPCWEGLSRLLSAVLTGEGSARWSASLPGVPRRGGNFMSGSQGARGQRGLRRLILSAGCCIRGRHDTGCLLGLLPLPHAPRRHLREVHSPGRAVRASSSPPPPHPVPPRAACVPGGIAAGRTGPPTPARLPDGPRVLTPHFYGGRGDCSLPRCLHSRGLGFGLIDTEIFPAIRCRVVSKSHTVQGAPVSSCPRRSL